MMGRDAGDKNILTLCNVEQTIDSRSGMLFASRPRGRAVQNLRPRTLLILGHFCFYLESQIITPTMKRSHTRRWRRICILRSAALGLQKRWGDPMQLFFSVEKTAAVMANSDETVPQCRRGV